MADQKEAHALASSFSVSIDGMNWDNFETVSGLGIELEDIALQAEGNAKQVINKPGRKNIRDIVLTRRFQKDPQLYQWIRDVNSKGLSETRNGSIILRDYQNKELVRFNFENAWPKTWNAPTLSRSLGSNDSPMETIVLSVSDLEVA